MTSKPSPRFTRILSFTGVALVLVATWRVIQSGHTPGRDSHPAAAPTVPTVVAQSSPPPSAPPEPVTAPAVPDRSDSASVAPASATSTANAPANTPAFTTAGRDLPSDFLDRIVSGNTTSFILPDGRQLTGAVDLIKRDAQGILFVQGRLTAPDPGFYFLQRQTVPGVAGALVGNVRFDGKDDAWKLEPTGTKGAPRLVARKLDEVICAHYQPCDHCKQHPEAAESAVEGDIQNAPQTHPTNIPIPSYQAVIPLQSLPGATGVLYLDFDGEAGPFAGWGNFDAAPSGASNTTIYNIWKMVSEDYQGFNLNITTDRKVFDNAPEGRRQHCIITPTKTASPNAGGVCHLGSFNFSGDTVNWAFYVFGKSSADVIAHECGHALGLMHDGRNTTPVDEYYDGHGTGPVGWAPIMGSAYLENLTQWSKGEYLNANNQEDDLSRIANNNNDVGYRPDDTGDTLATAKYLEIASDNSVSNEGIIEKTSDVDCFRFVTAGGLATLNVNTASLSPNLDIQAEIVNAATNVVIVSDNPDRELNAAVSATLAAGEYLLRVRGLGRGDPLVDGYTNYGSLGSYLISGSVAGAVMSERFSIAENTANGTPVGSVAPRNNHGASALTYAIASGNTNGAFAINSATGAITVANKAALDFEAFSLRWDDPATIEMFVTISDATTPSLNEKLRTVVTLTNLNEAPSISGSVTIPEHTAPGTKLLNAGADPDHFDFATFSITAGNTGNAFAIDPVTGQITMAADLEVASDTTYNLSVTATDQGTPALSTTATVTINVLNTLAGSWTTQDVGSVKPGANSSTVTAGSGTNGTSLFSITGSGYLAGSNNTADGMHFVSQPVRGDCEIIARVATHSGTDQFMRAGVAIRADLSAGAVSAYTVLRGGLLRPYFFHRSDVNGGSSPNNQLSTAVGAPYWVKLVRSGNNVSSFVSADGATWSQIGSSTTLANLPPTARVGLCVASGTTTSTDFASFDNVSIKQNVLTVTAPTTGPAEGTPVQTAAFTVSRGSNAPAGALAVFLTLGGTATYISDYTLSGGSVSVVGSTATVTIPDGQGQVSLTVTPLNDSLSEGPESINLTAQTSTSYSLGSPASASTSIAEGAASVADLTVFASPTEGGSVTGNGSYTAGSAQPITATPASGWHFVNWTGSGIADPNSASTTVTVDAAKTVTANFEANTYTLTYNSAANGTISGTTPQTVGHGASGTAVTAVPNTGYHFVNWSDGGTTSSRTDANVTADLTVSAIFQQNNPDANGNGILDAWETVKFGNANPGGNAASGDADGDGICNLMEYALDTDPLVPNTSPLIYDLEIVSGTSHLRLVVPKNPAATNLTYTVETCGSLDDWSAADTVVESSSINQLVARDTVAVPSASRRFVRLKVTVSP